MMLQKTLVLGLAVLLSFGLPSVGFGYDATCRILALDMDTAWDNEALNMLGVAYTLMSPQDFSFVDLNQFDVLYVGSAFKDGSVTIPSQDALDALNARAADIADFVQRGGGILALSEPIGSTNWQWTPVAVGGSGVYHANDVLLVDPTHPVSANLSSELLSNWGSSYHDVFSGFDPGLTVLATNYGGSALTLVGELGIGRMVFTGQDADFHLYWSGSGIPGTGLLISNALNWLCEPRVITVEIDITPGGFPNTINPFSRGVIPVAILTTPVFDAATVDPATVLFGPNGAAPSTFALEDVDLDGDLDLVLQFRTQATGIVCETTSATLTGTTIDGVKITGTDSVRTVGCR